MDLDLQGWSQGDCGTRGFVLCASRSISVFVGRRSSRRFSLIWRGSDRESKECL